MEINSGFRALGGWTNSFFYNNQTAPVIVEADRLELESGARRVSIHAWASNRSNTLSVMPFRRAVSRLELHMDTTNQRRELDENNVFWVDIAFEPAWGEQGCPAPPLGWFTPPRDDPRIHNLTLGSGMRMSPLFEPMVFEYNVDVPSNLTELAITFTAAASTTAVSDPRNTKSDGYGTVGPQAGWFPCRESDQCCKGMFS